ncbi:MAG: hypothetical protein ACI82F_002198 [Planctomycetota bacterium]|jgi:hypothetical protein
MKDHDDQQQVNVHGEARESRGELLRGLSFGGVGLACAGARVLVPGQLDGELSETQGNELRAHLLDCGACREVLKQETHLSRWFSEGAPEPAPVPAGFAGRVARRAYQSDPGIDFSDRLVQSPVSGPRGSTPKRGALLSFLLVSTAVAAAALFVFAVVLQEETLPQGEQLEAQDYTPPWERAASPLVLDSTGPVVEEGSAIEETALEGETPADEGK